jgi:hypothetical protein
MRDEEKLRDALSTIAGRAPDPGPVAAGITARTRAHRQRRGLLVASAAAVSGVGVAVAAWPRTPAPVPTPQPGVPAVSGPPAGTRAPIGYRPAWLPAGFAEVSRIGSVPGSGPVSQTRSWRRGTDPDDQIHLFLLPRSAFDPAGFDAVTLGGRRAWAAPGPGKVWVEVDDGLMLSVSVGRSDRTGQVARRVAASIEPDPGAVVAVSLAFGWVPDRFTGTVIAGQSGTADRAGEMLRRNGKDGGRVAVEAELVWEVSTAKGEPVTLRGLPGALYPGDPDRGCPDLPAAHATCGGLPPFARVEVQPGRLLRVTIGPGYEVTRAELTRIIEEITLGAAPDTSWLPPR